MPRAARVPAEREPMEKSEVEALYGTWRLLSWSREVVGTGERSDPLGNAPHGFITYTRDGRMSSMVVRANRPRPADRATLTDGERAALFGSMVAMAGTFTVEGHRVVHDIDISWNEAWTGTAQIRHFSIDGNRLTIRTDPAVSPIDGKPSRATLIWEKVE
jgi:hypothetical protein